MCWHDIARHNENYGEYECWTNTGFKVVCKSLALASSSTNSDLKTHMYVNSDHVCIQICIYSSIISLSSSHNIIKIVRTICSVLSYRMCAVERQALVCSESASSN